MSLLQPLPHGWLETQLGDVVQYAENKSATPESIPPDSWILELEDIESKTSRVFRRVLAVERSPKSNKNRFQRGDILYGKIRPYLCKVVHAQSEGYCSSEIIPLSPGIMDGRFLFYFLKSPDFTEYVVSESHGLSMPRLGTNQAKAAPFPLPPLAEQRRIAQKLDELLGQVEAVKARLERVQALSKRFRQAVLAAAVSGRLTEDWRSKVGLVSERDAIIPTSWSVTHLGMISTKVTDGEHATPKRETRGKILLSARNIHNNEIVLDKVDHVGDDEYKKIRKRCDPSKDDVLISCSGSVGRVALVDVDDAYVMVRSVALVRPNPHIVTSKYVMYYLQSPLAQTQIEDRSKSTAQSNLFLGEIKGLDILVPSVDEQHEIVRRIEHQFSISAGVEENISVVHSNITQLTQSILAKAFRGELVPQDPNDEPASVLLERIRAQRAEAPKAKRGRKPKGV